MPTSTRFFIIATILSMQSSGCAATTTSTPWVTSSTATIATTTAKAPASITPKKPTAPAFAAQKASAFTVTAGSIYALKNGWLATNEPTVRAELKRQTTPAAMIRFVYRGPTAESEQLANGELRRQIGLKLLAQDTCNVVYVMWHIAPTNKIEVSVKRNPNKTTHAACGDGGYTFLTPSAGARAPTIKPGSSHTLGATLRGDTLSVSADGKIVWTKKIPATLITFRGPIGFRSDNARLEFSFLAPPQL